MNIKPNAFIIGVQKSATTSLNYWLYQHPEIFGSENLKDVDFFLDPKWSKQLPDLLQEEYKTKHGSLPVINIKEPIVLLSAVNYSYYPQNAALIAKMSPEAKLILILRNPVDRTMSAYRYYKKLGFEKRNIAEAFDYDWHLNDSKFEFTDHNHRFTYIEHGLYFYQIKNILKYFPKEQLHIIEFDDMKNKPEEVLENVYDFLNISKGFMPELAAKNVTGKAKFTLLNQIVLSKNPFKKWLVKVFIKPWLPYSARRGFTGRLSEWNTRRGKQETIAEEDQKVIDKLGLIYKEDVANLDKLLNTSFTKQWQLDK